MTQSRECRSTKPAIVPVLLATLLLAGCSGGGVEFEGKIFDMVGLSDLGKPRKDPNVETRAPLVVPPKPKLPEPGARETAAAPENWPVDEREVRARELAAAKKKLKDYRDNGDWSKRAGIEEFDNIRNPMNRRTGLASKSSKGIQIESARDDVSADDLENIANNVDMEKVKADRRRQAEADAKNPDTSWVSKPGDEKIFKENGPDDVENMKGGW